MMINSDVVRRQKTAKPIYKAENVPPAGVVPNSDPCQIITPLVLIGLSVCVCVCVCVCVWGGGLGNQIAISTRGIIICHRVENGHNTGSVKSLRVQ